jgi:hypothetical protein
MSSSETENTEQSVPSSSTSSVLKKYFSYSIDKDKIKFGKCLICESEKKVKKFIKMKDSNTSGLKKHLLSCHQKIYTDAYNKKEITRPQLVKGQLTINEAFQQVP